MTVRTSLTAGLRIAAVALIAAGCSRETSQETPANEPVAARVLAETNAGAATATTTTNTTPTTNEAAAIRGEPIRGTPIQGQPIVAADGGSNGVPTSLTSGEKASSAAAAGLIPTSPLGYQVAAEAPKDVEAGYTGVGFDTLAGYEFDLTDDLLLAPPDKEAEAEQKTNAQIPKKIHELNDAKVAVMGFMLPLKVDAESGLVTEFLILRDQSMCCYGSVPKINQWISVVMTGKGVRPMMDQAVTLYGKLKVGAMRENGYLVGIYKLEGERMVGPQDM